MQGSARQPARALRRGQGHTFGSIFFTMSVRYLSSFFGSTFVTSQPLGRAPLKTQTSPFFSQTSRRIWCDGKFLLYSAFTCSTFSMPASDPPLNIFLNWTSVIVWRSLPTCFERTVGLWRGRRGRACVA